MLRTYYSSAVSIKNQFDIQRGIRQGDTLFTILFNIVLERAVRKMAINPGGTIYNRMTQILAYADYIIIISRSVPELQASFSQLEYEGTKVGLKVNTMKTKYMIASRDEHRWINITNITIQNEKFERVRSFKYLGSVITDNNLMAEEIKERLQIGNRCYWALTPLLKSNDLSKNGKIKVYKTIIKPIVNYAAQTWSAS